ncbi:MAG: hypothetical protein ACRDZQ_13545 [Acidimicrobiales bacterium]
MTRRRQRRAFARWEAETRAWATGAGRALVLALCGGQPAPVTPYRVGVALGDSEYPWAECPARFLTEPPPASQAAAASDWPPVRPWLVTSERVVGRLGDERLYGYRWDHMVGCRVDLTQGSERVVLDQDGQPPLTWTGPGIAPLAVAAVYRLHGAPALLDHPGLASLRSGGVAPRTEVRPAAELPPVHAIPAEWWR